MLPTLQQFTLTGKIVLVTGGEGDAGQREVGLIDQSLGRLNAPGRGHSSWACADVTEEEAGKMPGTPTQPGPPLREPPAPERPLRRQAHGTTNRFLRSPPDPAARPP